MGKRVQQKFYDAEYNLSQQVQLVQGHTRVLRILKYWGKHILQGDHSPEGNSRVDFGPPLIHLLKSLYVVWLER